MYNAIDDDNDKYEDLVRSTHSRKTDGRGNGVVHYPEPKRIANFAKATEPARVEVSKCAPCPATSKDAAILFVALFSRIIYEVASLA